MAQLVLGTAGAIIGFVASGGNPYAAQAGFALGSALGAALQPKPHQEGPRLTDLKVQTSTYGAAIPLIYGMYRLAGQLIWADKIIEHVSTTEQGGKGGGVEMTNYSYTCSFAIGICEGPIDGIRRIWADNKLVWDNGGSTVWETKSFTIYLGDEGQMPDPTMEGIIGAGLVPAHRGMAYVVFEDLELGKYGNRIPQFTFEVVRGNPTFDAEPPDYLGRVHNVPDSQLRRAVVDPDTGWIWTVQTSWIDDAPYTVTVTSDNPEIGTIASFSMPTLKNGSAMDIAVGNGKAYVLIRPYFWLLSVHQSRMAWIQEFTAGEANEDGSAKVEPAPLGIPTVWGREAVYDKKVYQPGVGFVTVDTGTAPCYVELINGVYVSPPHAFYGTPELWERITEEGPIDPLSLSMIGGKLWVGYGLLNTSVSSFACFDSKRAFRQVTLDGTIGYAYHLLGDEDWVGCQGSYYSTVGSFTVINTRDMSFKRYSFAYAATEVATFGYDTKRKLFLVTRAASDGSGRSSPYIRTLDPSTGEIIEKQMTVVVQDGNTPSYFVEAITYSKLMDKYIIGATNSDQALYASSTLYVVDPVSLEVEMYFTYENGPGNYLMGPMLDPKPTPGGRIYVIAFDNDHVKRLYLGNMDGSMPLWKIVRDISVKAGVGSGQIDVSELQDKVMGYGVTNVMPARSAIEPLTIAYKFDSVDSDGKVKFVKRGKTPVLSIDSSETLPETK